jgi:osomolarity two-component system response regulator SSK1
MAELKSKRDLAGDSNSNNNASSSSNSQLDQKKLLIDTTTAAAVKRPRLSYLRSAWTTTDLYYHESAFSQSSFSSFTSTSSAHEDEDGNNSEENIYQIRLPPLQLQDCDEDEDESDEVLKEIFRMITVANVLCLVGSLFSTMIVIYTVPNWRFFIEHPDWMPHAILPFYVLWWIFMMRVNRRRTTEHLRQYLNWTQLGAVIMALTTLIIPIRHPTFQHYHLLFASFSLISFFIYAFAKRIVVANESKGERFKKRILQQHEILQQVVDKHTEEFSNHRLAFLTTVSQEIQDVALMVITTLEQFSPASILFSAHELLSACSIAVPIASISAINTTIRQVCHVSSHLQLLSKLTIQAWTKSNNNLIQLPDLILAEFDIGELLQSLGDALAGVAAKLDVHLVIYHCDNNLHHTLVIGDEGAIRHALLNVSVVVIYD